MRVSELLVGKGAVKMRRIPVPQTGFPLQRVRDQSVPMGEAQGWSQEARSGRSLDMPVLRYSCLLAYNYFLTLLGHSQSMLALSMNVIPI
jgi:hypothetical protein